jgi:hypothetical protein
MTWLTLKFVWSVRLETSCAPEIHMHVEDQLQDAQEASHELGSKETRVSGKPVWEGGFASAEIGQKSRA